MSTHSTITCLCSHSQPDSKLFSAESYYLPSTLHARVSKGPRKSERNFTFCFSGTRELRDGISSVICETPTNSSGRCTQQRSWRPPQKEMMAPSKLKMLHWKFWKYEIWLRSKTEPCGKPENSLSLSAETTAGKTLNRTQLKAYGQGREHGNKNRTNGETHRDVFLLKVT